MIWLNHLPAYILPGPLDVAHALHARYPSLLNSLRITTEEAAGGLLQALLWAWRGHDFCAVALAAADALSLHDSAADGADCCHCAADHQSGPARESFAVTIVTFIICLAPIIANTTQGLISVDENLIHLFLMYKASPAQILFKLRLPNALPNLFTGIRISAGISVIGGITGELFAGSTRVGEGGLGYAIIYANNQMETATCLRWCWRRRCLASRSFSS